MKEIKTKIIKLLLSVLLPILDLRDEDAGEIFKAIIGYASTGETPHFSDKYKELYFKMIFEPIATQMETDAKRADQCRKASMVRSQQIKAGKRALSNDEHGKKLKKKNVPIENDSAPEILTDSDANGNPSTSEALSTVTYDNGNSSSSSNDMNDNQSVSNIPEFTDLLDQGILRDTGSFDGETGEDVWNEMTDDEKALAYSYAKEHRSTYPQYAHKFLTDKAWKNT